MKTELLRKQKKKISHI